MAGSNAAAPIQGILDRVVAEAESATAELEDRKAQLAAEIREVNEQLRSLNKVVNAARPSEKTKPKIRRAAASLASNPGVRKQQEAARARVKAAIEKVVSNGKQEFSMTDLESVGLSKSQADKGLRDARDLGIVRYIGERQNPRKGEPGYNKPVKTYTLA